MNVAFPSPCVCVWGGCIKESKVCLNVDTNCYSVSRKKYYHFIRMLFLAMNFIWRSWHFSECATTTSEFSIGHLLILTMKKSPKSSSISMRGPFFAFYSSLEFSLKFPASALAFPFNPLGCFMHLIHHHMHNRLCCASQANHQRNKMNPNAFQMDLLSCHKLNEMKTKFFLRNTVNIDWIYLNLLCVRRRTCIYK